MAQLNVVVVPRDSIPGHSLSVEFIRSTSEFFHPALLRRKLTAMAVCRGLPSLYRERNRLIRLSENVRIFGIISVISKPQYVIFFSYLKKNINLRKRNINLFPFF